MRALVLSGGGSKGAYQIGVWKALKKLNIKFDIVTGTSSGAINGALITQNTYFRALRVWKSLNYKNIFGDEFNNTSDINKLYKIFAKNFISDGGTEVNELHELINKNLVKWKFYNSKINYGLVTFNLTNRKPIELVKKDIPKDKLGEYILASASCFPAFKKMEIDGKDYIDGGYYDNVPINLAIKMGADEAIVVDLGSVGLKRRTIKKIKQITIKPNNNLSNFLVFDAKGAKKNIIYGYNDTMKVFNKLDGRKYTFKLNELDKFQEVFIEHYKNIIEKIFTSTVQLEKYKNLVKIETKSKIKKDIMNMIIEDIGYKYQMDDTRIYTYDSFTRRLRYKVLKDINKDNDNSIINFYNLLKEENYTKLKKESVLKPFDLLRAIFIYIIMEI